MEVDAWNGMPGSRVRRPLLFPPSGRRRPPAVHMGVRRRAVVPKGQEGIDSLLHTWLLHNDRYELHYEMNSPCPGHHPVGGADRDDPHHERAPMIIDCQHTCLPGSPSPWGPVRP